MDTCDVYDVFLTLLQRLVTGDAQNFLFHFELTINHMKSP